MRATPPEQSPAHVAAGTPADATGLATVLADADRSVCARFSGDKTSLLARVGTGRAGLMLIAALAAIAHMLDLASGLRMMLLFGIEKELNPLARLIFETAGPGALAVLKIAVVAGGIAVLCYLGLRGRGRLARNSLAFAAILGLLGTTSNLV